MNKDWIVSKSDPILITGAGGFIGSKVVEALLSQGFTNLRCFIRSSKRQQALEDLALSTHAHIEVLKGNLLNPNDCACAARNIALVYHLAIGSGGRSFPNAFMNAVIPTRNLLDALLRYGSLKRFVNVSSFAVYANRNKPRSRILDEQCPLDEHPEQRGDAYAFAKLRQDQIVIEYSNKFGVKYVILRPGAVYGPDNDKITGRVGIDTFGIFLHLGGPNRVPLTYVDNCADAVMLAGLVKGVDGEVFNVVDDDLPSSRCFLRRYKKHVQPFKSIYVPHALSYCLCYLWEKYCHYSESQLPLVLSRAEWHAYYKQTQYTNEKLKTRLGWTPSVGTSDGLSRYFSSCRQRITRA